MTKMLQKTENVAKNVANENSQDLTAQWEKGELPSRDDDHLWLAYYIKRKDGYIHADSLWRGHWGTADRNSIEQVLAPVPSYEEWKAKLEENTQLKELLKECSYRIDWRTKTGHKPTDAEKQELFDEISEVLK